MPLLSICIPTYNRAPHLEQTLQTIVSQKVFVETDLIEIVISNNSSTDNTQDVVARIAENFGKKIKYAVCDVPGDTNAINVLKSGTGTFLKLQNDNLGFVSGALDYIVDLIKKTQHIKPPIFFKNHGDQKLRILQTNSLDEFILEASYWTGWFGGFGIWKEHLDSTSDFGRLSNQQIFTTDEYFRLVTNHNKAIVVRTPLFAGTNVGKKGGYSLSKVYGTNYINLLETYLAKGFLKPETVTHEKKCVFLNHIVPYFFNQNHGFKNKGFFKEMSKYWDEPYFQDLIDNALLSYIPNPESNQTENNLTDTNKQAISPKNSPAQNWRLRNPHNSTYITNVREQHKVKVGNYSYGPLNVYTWNNDDEFLEIGNFVSIAENVEFLLGGNHKTQLVTNYPMRAIFIKTQHNEALTKGKITIHDDVWFGQGATILSGVTIGQGAVVAAKTVVTKDIPPYAIVAGNPSRIIGTRFPKEIVELLLTIDFSKIKGEMVVKHLELFETDPSKKTIEMIKNLISEHVV